MRLKHMILLSGLALLVVIASVLRPAWQPGVIEGGAAKTGPRLDDRTTSWLDAAMRRRGIPGVRVNPENSWGPGIGIQQIDGVVTIWHWGVNLPGYQALMLGRPETGDGVVVPLNGGPIMITPDGMRYSGLEFARELAARLLPGAHGAYWHGIQ